MIWRMYLDCYGLDANQQLPSDEAWTGAEIKACCRLSALLDMPLMMTAENIVPVAVTAAESVDRLRTWASGRCLHRTIWCAKMKPRLVHAAACIVLILPVTNSNAPKPLPSSGTARSPVQIVIHWHGSPIHRSLVRRRTQSTDGWITRTPPPQLVACFSSNPLACSPVPPSNRRSTRPLSAKSDTRFRIFSLSPAGTQLHAHIA